MSDDDAESTHAEDRRKQTAASPAKRRGCFVALLAPMLVLLLGGVLGPMVCNPAYTLDGEPPFDDAMTRANQCDAATALIGTNVRGRFGMGCNGSYESRGGHGHLDWTVPVKGDLAAGELYINATLQGGRWRTNSARLSVGDERVDLLQCP